MGRRNSSKSQPSHLWHRNSFTAGPWVAISEPISERAFEPLPRRPPMDLLPTPDNADLTEDRREPIRHRSLAALTRRAGHVTNMTGKEQVDNILLQTRALNVRCPILRTALSIGLASAPHWA